jgi:hypothetical protein
MSSLTSMRSGVRVAVCPLVKPAIVADFVVFASLPCLVYYLYGTSLNVVLCSRLSAFQKTERFSKSRTCKAKSSSPSYGIRPLRLAIIVLMVLDRWTCVLGVGAVHPATLKMTEMKTLP